MKKMVTFLKNMFTSWKIVLILLVHVVILLAAATFIESKSGSEIARLSIYNNPLFYLLLLMLVLCFFGTARKHRLWINKRFGVLIFHIAFVFILCGALITSLLGYEGVVHIREGGSSSTMQTKEDIRKLPFTIQLRDFRLVRYPGSNSPSSFESDLVILVDGTAREERIFMNKVIYEQGYRIYQSSYDPDEQGTILTVNNDLPGTVITYIGYVWLLIGMIVLFCDPKSRFRQLNRQLKTLTSALLLSFFSLGVSAQDEPVSNNTLLKNTLPSEVAEQWGKLQIQCPTGRVEPVNTYTSKLLRKIHRSDRFEGLSSEQVILGFIINPGYWSHVKLIRQSNKELRKELSLPEGYISFFDLFNAAGTYKIADKVDKAYAKAASERTNLDKDLLKLDEKINILYALQEGQLFSLFPLPEDINGKWYSTGDDLSDFFGKDSLFVARIMDWYCDEALSGLRTGEWKAANEVLSMIDVYQKKQSTVPLSTERQVQLEIFYNKARLFFWSAIGYMLLGMILLTLSISKMLKTERVPERKSVLAISTSFVKSCVGLVFFFHCMGIAIRWYISGQAPGANAYESMIFVAWATALVGLLFFKRSVITVALSSFFAGIILFVANLNWMDPEITPLVPVLKSYWLMIHVAVITSSYGFFGVSSLLGIISMVFTCMKRKSSCPELLQLKIKELRLINEMSLYIGICLLAAGIFVGAVWANESWGRYWGWDPKETWALVTLLVYAFVIHARFVPFLRSDYAFHVLSIIGFTSVLMTYFGVNYYLSGLHSYGRGETPPALNIVFILYGLILLLILWAGYVERRNIQRKTHS